MELGFSLRDYEEMLEDKKVLRRELRNAQIYGLESQLNLRELEIKALEKKIKELEDKKANR